MLHNLFFRPLGEGARDKANYFYGNQVEDWVFCRLIRVSQKNKNNRNVNKTGVGRGVKLTVLLRPTSSNAAQQQEQTKPPRSQTHDC